MHRSLISNRTSNSLFLPVCYRYFLIVQIWRIVNYKSSVILKSAYLAILNLRSSNPRIIRFKPAYQVYGVLPMPLFNPIIVRFKQLSQVDIFRIVRPFNPIIVRFKLHSRNYTCLDLRPFNPIIVRFKRGVVPPPPAPPGSFQSYHSSI
jgi:hypothetical protein